MAAATAARVLDTVAGSNGATHHIIEAHDGAVYCTCTGWKFSKATPKTCKHLEAWSAANPRGPVITAVALGTDKHGYPVYVGSWIADTDTGFVMRAQSTRPWGAQPYFLSADKANDIPARHAYLFDPTAPTVGDDTSVAPCDRDAFNLLRGQRTGWLYAVICRADRQPDGSLGEYQLATRQLFSSRQEALDRHAVGISGSREPIVVAGHWGNEEVAHIRITQEFSDGEIGRGTQVPIAETGAIRVKTRGLRLPVPQHRHFDAPQPSSPAAAPTDVFQLDWL